MIITYTLLEAFLRLRDHESLVLDIVGVPDGEDRVRANVVLQSSPSYLKENSKMKSIES